MQPRWTSFQYLPLWICSVKGSARLSERFTSHRGVKFNLSRIFLNTPDYLLQNS
nr:MAG TPA: hypothetical protein [Bacteriophage sp.]